MHRHGASNFIIKGLPKTQMMVDDMLRVKAINGIIHEPDILRDSIITEATSDMHNDGSGTARIDIFEAAYDIKHEMIAEISMLGGKNLHCQVVALIVLVGTMLSGQLHQYLRFLYEWFVDYVNIYLLWRDAVLSIASVHERFRVPKVQRWRTYRGDIYQEPFILDLTDI